MKKDTAVVNGKSYIVTIEKLPEEMRPLIWVEAIMQTPAYSLYILKLIQQNTLAVRIVTFLSMCLTKKSPFIPMTQKLLAEKLGANESNVSTAMKFLYEDDVVIKVNSETFAINPRYVFKCSFKDRELWVRILEGEGYQNAFVAFKASETLDNLKEKYKQCTT